MNIYMKDNLCTIYKLEFNRMEQFFKSNGANIVKSPEEGDIMVLGTCAAFDADEGRSVEIMDSVKKYGKKTYIYGCLTVVNPKKVGEAVKFPSWNAKELCENIINNGKVSWEEILLPYDFRTKEDYRVFNKRKKFIGITKGCSFLCTYCPHRLGAGKLVSRDEEDILKQINILNKEDLNTIVLTGIDTASWGRDTGKTFSDLLKSVLEDLREDISVHIAQFNPEGLMDDFYQLVELCKDKRVKELQLPIQTTSQRLLGMMKRYYSIDSVRDFIKSVKSENNGIMFRTDIMVGFPTETVEELNDSIDFAINHFDEVAVYGFEMKDNTEIAALEISGYSNEEIEERRSYAYEKIREKNLLVHSGGQDYCTLLSSDNIKEKIRSGRV